MQWGTNRYSGGQMGTVRDKWVQWGYMGTMGDIGAIGDIWLPWGIYRCNGE